MNPPRSCVAGKRTSGPVLCGMTEKEVFGRADVASGPAFEAQREYGRRIALIRV